MNENKIIPMTVDTRKQTPIEIALQIDGEGKTTARKLYEYLELDKSNYSRWAKTNIEKNQFAEENVDYLRLVFDDETPTGGTIKREDYKLTACFAKKLTMSCNNKRGEEARDYFIKIESKLKEIIMEKEEQKKLPTSYKEAVQQLLVEIEEKEKLEIENTQQKELIGELKPKADYTDLILQNESLIAITQIAKDYGMSAVKFNALLHSLKVQHKINGQWVLYANYQDKGYAHSTTVTYANGEGCCIVTMWTQKGRMFLYNLLKKQSVLPLIEQEELQLIL